MKVTKKNIIEPAIIGTVLLGMIAISFMKPPEDIAAILSEIARKLNLYAAFTHIVFLAVLLTGLLFKRNRNLIFFGFMAFLALSATITSIYYMLPPNILAFSAVFILLIKSYLRGELNFTISGIKPTDKYFAVLALVFGFWYLHWVETPIWLNAFIFSPLGLLNCPTLLTICGFLCLTVQPRSVMLELTTAIATLHFGLFGILFLAAYVDIVLVVCSLYLIVRSGVLGDSNTKID